MDNDSTMSTADEPYIYTKVKFSFGDSKEEWDLPQSNSNAVALEMMAQLVRMVHAEGFLFRMTKDKICWREPDGTQFTVEFS